MTKTSQNTKARVRGKRNGFFCKVQDPHYCRNAKHERRNGPRKVRDMLGHPLRWRFLAVCSGAWRGTKQTLNNVGTTSVVTMTLERKRDRRLRQATKALATNQQGAWLLRRLRGESRTTTEVVLDEVLMTNDSIDLIIAELDRGFDGTHRARTTPPRLSELSTQHKKT